MERSRQFSPQQERQGWGKLVWGLWMLNFFFLSPSLPSWLLQTQEGKRGPRKWAVVVTCASGYHEGITLRIWLFFLSLLFLRVLTLTMAGLLLELGQVPCPKEGIGWDRSALLFIQVCVWVCEACHHKVLQVEWSEHLPRALLRLLSMTFRWPPSPYVFMSSSESVFKFPPLIRTPVILG